MMLFYEKNVLTYENEIDTLTQKAVNLYMYFTVVCKIEYYKFGKYRYSSR
jgi:hypothetical protein